MYKKFGNNNLDENSIELNFKGSAGQSFGAFAIKGLKLILKGDANDYVAKGLSGGTIVIKLQDESNLVSNENTAVRNSGATAVVEGCDSNGCEYMTGGNIIILGDIGDNFGAGMTGGMAFIYDPENQFDKKVNPEHAIETNSTISKKIVENFENEINNFVQVCPKEMLDKLENPISNKKLVGQAS